MKILFKNNADNPITIQLGRHGNPISWIVAYDWVLFL